MSWSFDELKSRLEHKLKYLVVVKVLDKKVNGNQYFKYVKPDFYVFESFDNFLNMISNGKIYVTFKLTYNKTVEKYGEFLDKGTSFDISYDDIEELFYKINQLIKNSSTANKISQDQRGAVGLGQ